MKFNIQQGPTSFSRDIPQQNAITVEREKLKLMDDGKIPATPSFGEVLDAKIQLEAPILSRIDSEGQRVLNNLNSLPDPSYNPYTDEDIPAHLRDLAAGHFVNAKNKEHALAIANDLHKQEDARQVIENSSWGASIGASLVTQVIDPLNLATNLIPVGRVAKTATVAGAGIKGAIMTGAAVGAGQAIQEVALHEVPTIKTWQESALDTGVALAFGTVLGGVTSTLGQKMLIQRQTAIQKELRDLINNQVQFETGAPLHVPAEAPALRTGTAPMAAEGGAADTVAAAAPIERPGVAPTAEPRQQTRFQYGPTSVLSSSDSVPARELAEAVGHTQARSSSGRLGFTDLEGILTTDHANLERGWKNALIEARSKGSKMSPDEFRTSLTDVLESGGTPPRDLIAKYGPDDPAFTILQREASNTQKLINKYIGYAQEMGAKVESKVGKLFFYVPNIAKWGAGQRELALSLNNHYRGIAAQELAKNGQPVTEDAIRAFADSATNKALERFIEGHQKLMTGEVGSIGDMDIPPEIMKPFVERDIANVFRYFKNTALQRLNVARAVGEDVGRFQNSSMYKAAMQDFQTRINNAPDAATANKLLKEQTAVRRAVEDIDNEIWGAPVHENDVGAFASNLAAKLAGVGQLPLAALSNLQEVVAPIMIDSFGGMFKAVMRDIGGMFSKGMRAEREAMLDLGAAADVMSNEYKHMVGGVYDYRFGRDYRFLFGEQAAVLEKMVDKVYNGFMSLSLTPWVNKQGKIFATRVMEQRMIRLAEQVEKEGWAALKPADAQWMKDVNFDEKTMGKFIEMYRAHGTTDGHKMLNFRLWEEAAQSLDDMKFNDAVKAAFNREVNAFQQTGRVGEVPTRVKRFMGSEAVGRIVFAYTRFMWHVWNNVVVKGWERDKANLMMTLASTAAVGYVAQKARYLIAGQNKTEEETMWDLAKNFGPAAVPMMALKPTGLLQDVENGWELGTTFTQGGRPSSTWDHYKRMPIAAVSYAATVGQIASKGAKAAFGEGKWSGKDTHDLVKAMPILGGFANLPYVKPFTREATDMVNDIFGLEDWDQIQEEAKRKKEKYRQQVLIKSLRDNKKANY